MLHQWSHPTNAVWCIFKVCSGILSHCFFTEHLFLNSFTAVYAPNCSFSLWAMVCNPTFYFFLSWDGHPACLCHHKKYTGHSCTCPFIKLCDPFFEIQTWEQHFWATGHVPLQRAAFLPPEELCPSSLLPEGREEPQVPTWSPTLGIIQLSNSALYI